MHAWHVRGRKKAGQLLLLTKVACLLFSKIALCFQISTKFAKNETCFGEDKKEKSLSCRKSFLCPKNKIGLIHSCIFCSKIYLIFIFNPNWHEAGHFPPPCPFWIRFCQLNLSKISNLFWS